MKGALQYLSPLVFVLVTYCFYDRFIFTFKEVHRPGVPSEVLSLSSRQVVDLIQEQKLADYQLSSKFLEDVWLHYQTVTAAWPVRLEKNSKMFFFTTKEVTPPGCVLQGSKSEVLLAKCP